MNYKEVIEEIKQKTELTASTYLGVSKDKLYFTISDELEIYWYYYDRWNEQESVSIPLDRVDDADKFLKEEAEKWRLINAKKLLEEETKKKELAKQTEENYIKNSIVLLKAKGYKVECPISV